MPKDKRPWIIGIIAIIVPIVYCVSMYSYASGLSSGITQESRLKLQPYYDKFAEMGFVCNYRGATDQYGRVVMTRTSADGSADMDEINYLIDKSVEAQSIKGYASSSVSLTYNSRESLADIANEVERILDVFGVRFADMQSTIMDINWQDAKNEYDAHVNNNYDYKKPVLPILLNNFGSMHFRTNYVEYPEPNYYLTVRFIAD